jgi:hypothetical protein
VTGPLSTDQRAFATEWAEAEIRVIRDGGNYKMEIRARDDIGTWVHQFIRLDEHEAGDLRWIWQEIT